MCECIHVCVCGSVHARERKRECVREKVFFSADVDTVIELPKELRVYLHRNLKISYLRNIIINVINILM